MAFGWHTITVRGKGALGVSLASGTERGRGLTACQLREIVNNASDRIKFSPIHTISIDHPESACDWKVKFKSEKDLFWFQMVHADHILDTYETAVRHRTAKLYKKIVSINK